ncbi:hypothetical protein CRM22_006717 [Opisthorchis felineus]|uniref:C2H2-type domain-containing protein n=1 Tax=Opisthorchis felineus TaxID=147828 RepID=A0A4S2LJJ2_OPIFE|nr:hypothetical protein CRM22_006717 [Opisthorchis felineus]
MEEDCSNADRLDEPDMQTDQRGGYRCLICSNSFPCLSAAERQHGVHATTADFYCNVCEKVFKTAYWFQQHTGRPRATEIHPRVSISSKLVQESEERGNPCPEYGKCHSGKSVLASAIRTPGGKASKLRGVWGVIWPNIVILSTVKNHARNQ